MQLLLWERLITEIMQPELITHQSSPECRTPDLMPHDVLGQFECLQCLAAALHPYTLLHPCAQAVELCGSLLALVLPLLQHWGAAEHTHLLLQLAQLHV